jgi:hypothetical protein
MELIKTLALIVAILIALKMVLNKMNDKPDVAVRVYDTLPNQNQNKVQSETERKLRESFMVQTSNDIANQPQAKDLDIIASNLPTAKAAGSGAGNCLPVAPNDDSVSFDHEAVFSNEVTDLAHAFSTDPALFFNDQRHNVYVPDTTKWGEQADMMYQAKLNDTSNRVQEHNFEDKIANI